MPKDEDQARTRIRQSSRAGSPVWSCIVLLSEAAMKPPIRFSIHSREIWASIFIIPIRIRDLSNLRPLLRLNKAL